MKELLNKLIILALFIPVVGCQSNAEKLENAQEKVAEEREELAEAKEEANEVAQQVATAEQWQAFKTESERKIKENEVRIAELREKMKKSGKALDSVYAKNIDTLEERNRNLRLRMDGYETNQSDWEAFKREFNHDMDELGQALKDLMVDNKN